MRVLANVLLPEPFGPIRAWISPLRTSRLSPLRISFPSTATWRSLTTSSGVWLMVDSGSLPPLGRRLSRPFDRLARSASLVDEQRSGNRSGREALPARAAVPHVRVVELEPGPHQALDVLDLGAVQQGHALGVHDQLDAVALVHLVALGL